ncbi:MAG TPA: DUF1854 domain-containing protein [Gemmatimonadales bacterium]|jgi:hypothetical protein
MASVVEAGSAEASAEVANPHVPPSPPGQGDRGLGLSRRVDGRLWAEVDGVARAVSVRRCFPWSEAARFISLRDDNEEEVALVEDPASLDPVSRAALDAALVEAGFVLEVTRVVSIEEEVEIRDWHVETRQGARSFQTRLDDWPLVMPGGGILVRDVAGDLYYIARPKEMDKESKGLLWAFVD